MIKKTKLLNCAKWCVEKRKTTYINRYPYNLGYCHSDKTLSFDCWNLIKALIWSGGAICHNNTVGTFQAPNLSTGLGDWDGKTMLEHCTQKTKVWKGVKINVCELLITGDYGHAGLYVGDITYNGNAYNVIECNSIAGQNGVMYSYVDPETGKRYDHKDGNLWGAWVWHGLMPWIDYTDGKTASQTKTYKTIKAVVEGIIKGDFGTGDARKENLYQYFQKLVNAELKK